MAQQQFNWNLDGKGNNEAKNIIAHKNFIRKYFTRKIFNFEENQWKLEVKKKRKLNNYSIYKTQLKLDNYLLTPGYFSGRAVMTNMRSSTSKLEVELGRHVNIGRDFR